MIASVTGIGDVADLWPYLWLILRGMVVLWFLSLLLFWQYTRMMRKQAYGPGMGRKYVREAVAADVGSNGDRGGSSADLRATDGLHNVGAAGAVDRLAVRGGQG